jgi:hypothetical protein
MVKESNLVIYLVFAFVWFTNYPNYFQFDRS